MNTKQPTTNETQGAVPIGSGAWLGCGAAIHHLGRERREVRIMAIAEGYAMVRRKGAMPYICDVKELTQSKKLISAEEAATLIRKQYGHGLAVLAD
jgi:hypothetical protein